MRIDPHVHLRDWPSQKHKETMEHGFLTAWRSGLSGVFEMPNTDPPLTSEKVILSRLEKGNEALKKLGLPLFHGIFAGLTPDPDQIVEVVKTWKDLFPSVAGLKMFAGHSTGNMGITEPGEQRRIFEILSSLNYTGVLMVHCEKESLLKPGLFYPEKPETHLASRPPEAEVESVREQIRWAQESRFKGTLHICHISVPESLKIIEEGREKLSGRLTCGITPHHGLLSVDDMKGSNGILLKVNPPLREKNMQKEMLRALLDGRIDWIETDHAPHTKEEKRFKHLSGIPVLQFYGTFIEILKNRGLGNSDLEDLTFNNIIEAFEIGKDSFKENPGAVKIPVDEYGFDPFAGMDGGIKLNNKAIRILHN